MHTIKYKINQVIEHGANGGGRILLLPEGNDNEFYNILPNEKPSNTMIEIHIMNTETVKDFEKGLYVLEIRKIL